MRGRGRQSYAAFIHESNWATQDEVLEVMRDLRLNTMLHIVSGHAVYYGYEAPITPGIKRTRRLTKGRPFVAHRHQSVKTRGPAYIPAPPPYVPPPDPPHEPESPQPTILEAMIQEYLDQYWDRKGNGWVARVSLEPSKP